MKLQNRNIGNCNSVDKSKYPYSVEQTTSRDKIAGKTADGIEEVKPVIPRYWEEKLKR